MHEGNSIFNKIKNIFRNIKGILFTVIILAAVVTLFLSAVNGASQKADSSSTATVEKAVRKAAVQCYAIEGFYPPDVDYLVSHYGVIIDRSKYAVSYISFTANNMPDIKVKIAGEY